MTCAPQRRWFRFSLRTLFVVVTVIACWLGWNVQIVRRRTATRAILETLGAEIDDEVGQFPEVTTANKWASFVSGNVERAHVSLIRRWLGDRAVWGISFPPTCPRELIERFDRDFPETPAAHRVY
jgi:hypothetical protein